MLSAEKIIKKLLSSADIRIDGSRPWDVIVHNSKFYRRILTQSTLGLGESYMDGWWDCEAIDQYIYKVITANLNTHVKPRLLFLSYLKSKVMNLQSMSRAFEVGERHYDLGNDLFKNMLDPRMTYSCGYWKFATNLAQAQEAKLDLICRKLDLKSGMRVLDIGCGFGCFAKYAAEKYGVEVVGLTVSKEQAAFAKESCAGLPVEIRLQDYRGLNERFDRVMSLAMFEAVGQKNHRIFMETIDRCLRDDGIAFIHTIGSNVCWKSVDPWIHKFIFPNGMLPSIAQIGRAMNGLFVMEDWHNFGPDYDKTLMAWHDNFEKHWPRLQHRYNERFYRMWKFYLLSCAGAFRARHLQLWQLVMTKPGRTQPYCRIS